MLTKYCIALRKVQAGWNANWCFFIAPPFPQSLLNNCATCLGTLKIDYVIIIVAEAHKQVSAFKCATPGTGTALFHLCKKKPLMWGNKRDGIKRVKIMQRCPMVQWPHPAFHLSLVQFDLNVFFLTVFWMQVDIPKRKMRLENGLRRKDYCLIHHLS